MLFKWIGPLFTVSRKQWKGIEKSILSPKPNIQLQKENKKQKPQAMYLL